MIELSRQQSKKIRQGILDEIALFCNERSLTFYLSGSTLLGAVREKSLLAWNDRISIMLPRPDFTQLERFFNVYAKSKGLPLRLVTAETVDAYGYAYAKIADTASVIVSENQSNDGLGISVCVVAIDGLGNDRKEAEKLSLKTEKAAQILRYKTYGREVADSTDTGIRFLSAFTSRAAAVARLKCPSPYEFEKSELVGVLGVGYKARAVVKRSIFEGKTEVELEGRLYPAPIGYHDYLQALFDDYMSLPPEKERGEVKSKVYSQSREEE